MTATTCQIASDIERPIDLAVTIPTPDAQIEGDWSIPRRPRGVIILANGTGTSRLGRRNRQVAQSMYDAGYATLLLDLLTPMEEKEDQLTGVFHVNVLLLADRLTAATEWVHDKSALGDLPCGYLTSGTASGAALIAAAQHADLVDAVVSRGGRPDLAGVWLTRVTVPTLLIVGGEDTTVLGMNRWALRRLNSIKKLIAIPGATHLFEESGSLGVVSRLARSWFESHLRPPQLMPFKGSAFALSTSAPSPALVPQ